MEFSVSSITISVLIRGQVKENPAFVRCRNGIVYVTCFGSHL